MCNYQAWYHNSQTGYIIQCNECKRLLAGFGNVTLNFTPAEFQKFRMLLNHLYQQRHPAENPNAKTVMIPTPAEAVTLLFSLKELEEICNMFETADNEIKTQQLINEFSLPGQH